MVTVPSSSAVKPSTSEVAASKAHTAGSKASSASDRTTKTLLDLPDELLSCMVDHCEESTLKSLQLSAKSFVPLCRAALWSDVSLEDDFESHDRLLCHLVKSGLSTYVRELTYPILGDTHFSHSACFLLANHFPNLKELSVTGFFDDEEDDEEHKVVPPAFAETIGSMVQLQKLYLHDLHDLPKSFSLAQLPHLSHFAPGSLIVAESLLSNAPSALRSLKVKVNDFSVSIIETCLETLEILALEREAGEDMGSTVTARCLTRLRTMYLSSPRKPRFFPLKRLEVRNLEIIETRNALHQPQTRVIGFLSALQGSTCLNSLSFKHFRTFRAATDDDPGFGLLLPHVRYLELEIDGSDDVCFLDNDTILVLRSFLAYFPSLAHLRLIDWLAPLDPCQLATLPPLEFGLYSPITYLLLEPLQHTAIVEVRLESSFWEPEHHVRLIRDGDTFVRELILGE